MRLKKLLDVELPAADQLPDGAVLLYDRLRGRWVARVLDTGGEVPEHTHSPSDIAPQGEGSGLDADTVDGQHASEFATVSHEHTLTVLRTSNDASVTINQTTSSPVQITNVSLSSGRWIIIGVVQALASSTTSATLHSYLRSGTTNLTSFSVSANSNHGLLTPVLVLLRNVSSSETITLSGATSNTSYTFTIPVNGGIILAIRYGPVGS